ARHTAGWRTSPAPALSRALRFRAQLLPICRQQYYLQLIDGALVHDSSRAGTPLQQFMLHGIYRATGEVHLAADEDYADALHAVVRDDENLRSLLQQDRTRMDTSILLQLRRDQQETAMEMAVWGGMHESPAREGVAPVTPAWYGLTPADTPL
ncbi:hypothetical protein B484DRAFT_439343, partial [Ochromonadaceae sp. CCMP2298]